MSVKIKFDNERNIIEPVLVLMNRNANKIGTIPYYSFKAKINLNSYSELSFVVDKNSCSETLWDNLVDFKLIWVRDWNLCFEMYVDTNEDNSTRKTITANSLGESELSQINLYDIEINTETDINRDDYVPTVLYNNENHSASLMHRIMEKCPHYTIGHVDSTIANIQRTFTFSNQSIYDSLNKIAEEIGCLFLINCSLSANGNLIREINIYDLERSCSSCGYRDDSNYTVCPKCGGTNILEGYGEDTNIFVSSKNLAEQINFTTDTGSVKNCFRLVAGDDLMNSAVISCNPNGGQYLWYISQEMRDDMPSELVNKIDQYLQLCEYYQNEYSVSLSSSWVNEYNSLIQKYSVYTSRFNSITLPIVGSSSLMENLYNVLDFDIYLKNEMMPTPEISDTTAAIQAQKLTAENLSPISVTDLSSLSLSTANNAVLGMAKVLIDNRYKVSIVSSTLSNNIWQGSFNVVNYSNEEDTATSNTINIVINDNYENFLKQKIDKALEKSMTTNDPIDIVSLFKLSLTNFKKEIKKYSLSILKSFYDNCETCLDVLIEQGVANSNTWAGQTPNLYNTLYVPYRNKLTALEQETKLRETEISKVERIKNALIQSENTIQSNLDLASYMGEALWKQFAAYRREDTYQNDNYISDGLNNTELFEKANAFIREAQKNIYKSANLQHSISTTLKNLLLMKEFEPIVDYFEVGNWIRVKVDNDIYKLRLISYEIDLDPSNSNLAVEFSDVIKVSDGLSDIQSILAQSKSISSSYSSVKRQAKSGNEGSNKVNRWINDGIALNNIKILEDAENQNIQFDNNGLLCREYLPLIDDYSDQQLKIINKGIYLTDDKWNNAKVGIGEIEYNGTKYYGVNGEILIGNIIMGNELHILDNQGREIFTVVDGKIHSQIQDNNENYVDGHIADSANAVKTYADTQITQTADSITSEVSKKVRATVGYDDENLIDFSVMTQTSGSGITFTVDDKGVVTATGTATKDAYCNFVLPDSVYGNYYLTGCPDGGKDGSTNKYLVYIKDETTGAIVKKHDGTTASAYLRNENESTEVQLIQGYTNRVRILIYNGTTVNNLEFNPCVSKHKKVTTELSETNSRITQTADSITLQVNDNLNRAASSDAVEYKTPTDITINYYGYGLIDEATTDTGKKASDNNGRYYLDRKTGIIYKSNGSTWVENRTLPQKLDDYYTSSQANAAIEVSAQGIKQTVGNSTSKYDTTGYDIDYYGLDNPTDAGYPAPEHNGKFYLDQSAGFVYKSNGTSWSKQNSEALPLISTQLGSKIDQTAESITSTVGKATSIYDTTGYTIHYYGFGFKKNDDGTINYAITDSGNKASGNNNKYFLDQSTGYLYKSNNSVWAEPNPTVHFTPITTNLNSKIEQTAESITQTVFATYTTKDESNEMLGKTASPNPVEYIMPTGITIDYYGYGLKSSSTITDTGKKASEETDKRFLNRANGVVYKSNGTKWVKDTDISPNPLASKLNEAVTELNSSIVQTAEKISLEANARLEATVGYSSKNQFEITGTTTTVGEVTFTVNKSAGTVKATNANTATASRIFTIGTFTFVPGKQYILSGCPSGGGSSSYRLYPQGLGSEYYDDGNGSTIEVTEEKTVNIRCIIYAANTTATVTFKPMIRDASIADATFEPYKSPVQDQLTETNARITETANSITLEVNKKVNTSTLEANYDDKDAVTAKANTARDTAKSYTDDELTKYTNTVDMHTAINQKADSISLEAKARLEATVGYSSKNLFEITADTQTKNGITFTIDKTAGTIKVNGTATAQTALSIEFNVPSGDYYFSGCPSGGSSSTYDLYAYDRDYSESGGGRPRKWDGTTASASDYGNTSQEIKIVGGHETVLTIRIQSGVTISNKIFKPMIRKGAIADATFEPYRSVQTQFDDTNSKIDITTNGIMLSSAQMAYGKRTKNLIPFVLESASKSSSSGGTTCTRSGNGYKLTKSPTSGNQLFTLYTSNGVATIVNSKLPNSKTLPTGKYIVSGTGFNNDIQYRIVYSTDGSTRVKVEYLGESGDTAEKTFEITDAMTYVQHYIWVREGADLGSGVTVRPMIRDANIADSSYSEGIDAGAYMCSAINLTPEKLELDAGKLIINSDNFSLDANGKCTLGGDSIIQSKNYVSNTSGMKIKLSDGTIDSKNFKVSSDGTVTATGATITGGKFQVSSTNAGDNENNFISLKNEYVSEGKRNSFTINITPYHITHQYTRNSGSTDQTSIENRDIMTIGNNGVITLENSIHTLNPPTVLNKPKTTIGTNKIRLEETEGTTKPFTEITPSGITTPNMTLGTLYGGNSANKVTIMTPLSFTTNYGWIEMGGNIAMRLYNNEIAVGAGELPLRIYATAAYTPTAWVVSSDARRKHDVESLDNRYLNVIKSIEPKRFRYLDNPLDRYHTGYIAQDVKAAMDKLNVSTDELSAFVDINGDGSDLALRYGEMIPLLHKWLKELDGRITAIEKRKEG